MDERQAIGRLPEAYAQALRLRQGGASDDEIADQLGVDRAGVPALLALAEAKLDRHREVSTPPPHDERSTRTRHHA